MLNINRSWLGPVSIGLAAKVCLLLVFAWRAPFVMDEFWQAGQSKYLFNGLFETIWPAKAVGYAMFYKLAHMAGWDAASTMLIARMMTAIVSCAILFVTYSIARCLGEDRLRALLIVLVLLAFSNFIERSFRTRAEPLSVLCATGALFIVLRGHRNRATGIVLGGVMSGFAFLITQKAIYFNIALGLALVLEALSRRDLKGAITRGAWLITGWIIPVMVYCLGFGGADFTKVLVNLIFGPSEVALHGQKAYVDLNVYVWQTLARNAPLYLICFVSLGLSLIRYRTLQQSERIAAVFTLVVTILVFLHNQPWPYVFVMVLPFLALWSLRLVPRTGPQDLKDYIYLLVLLVGIAMSFVSNVAYFRFDNREELAVIKQAEGMLARDEAYFDGIGMLPARYESTRLWLDAKGIQTALAQGQASQAFAGLSGSPPALIIWSYRMDLIEPLLSPLLERSYVPVAPNIRLPGISISPGRPTEFDVPKAGLYRLYGENGEALAGAVEINGTQRATPVELERGTVQVALVDAREPALLVYSPCVRVNLDPQADDHQLFAHVYD